MKLVSLHHVSVSYDKVPVLTDVDLDIRNDDFIGVIGPNGGGKTTLVKAILKAVPYSGEVIYAPEIENRGCRRIGYLPQISEIDKSFPISVREVVLSGLQARKRLFGRYTAEDRQKADELLHTCRIEEIARKPIGALSGGQIQRTLLCRALISDPELLILDEPTNFVDNQFEKELYLLLKRFNEKMAIVMVSHDLGTISSYVRSIVCVNRRVHRHDSNIITAEQENRGRAVRFQPVSTLETPQSMIALCDAFQNARQDAELDPLLLIPMFILDFLCIHPFNDGNERMSRLLILLLLYRSGYIVGKYISIEKLISDTKETYYDAVQASSYNWHEGTNDYVPFVIYMLRIFVTAYRDFEDKIELLTTKRLSKPDRVRETIKKHLGKITKSEIMANCPDISQITVQRALADLMRSGEIIKLSGGRYTSYIWNRERK